MSDSQRIVLADDPVKAFWENFRTHAFNSVRGVLTNQMVFDACRAVQWNYRERCLPPVQVILHMVLAAIWPEDSFAASWQVLWAGGCAQNADHKTKVCPPSSGSQAKARQRIPLAVWRYILDAVTHRAVKLGAEFDRWRGLRPILVDGTCLSMPAEQELFDTFGTCRSRGQKGRFPLTRSRVCRSMFAELHWRARQVHNYDEIVFQWKPQGGFFDECTVYCSVCCWRAGVRWRGILAVA